MESHDVVIIGGGQAGLALGHQLANRGTAFVIVDAGGGAGDSWRARWDSLRPFTPAGLDALPGLAFPGDPDRLPTKDEVADYLAEYNARFDLPVRWRTRVRRLTTAGDAYVLETSDGALTARQVVIATGPFRRPWRPGVARQLDESVHQVHSSAYQSPDELPDGPVLVVGGGNSGLQIAAELAATRPTTLSVGSRHPYLPQRVAGRNVFRWARPLGLMSISRSSPLGRYLRRQKEVVVGLTPRRLRRRPGVSLTSRIVACLGVSVISAGGSVHRPRSVIWATGYVPDFDWVDLPVVDADGWIGQERGYTASPGLYTLGVPWQRTNASALITGVGSDAVLLAQEISADAGRTAVRQRPGATSYGEGRP